MKCVDNSSSVNYGCCALEKENQYFPREQDSVRALLFLGDNFEARWRVMTIKVLFADYLVKLGVPRKRYTSWVFDTIYNTLKLLFYERHGRVSTSTKLVSFSQFQLALHT